MSRVDKGFCLRCLQERNRQMPTQRRARLPERLANIVCKSSLDIVILFIIVLIVRQSYVINSENSLPLRQIINKEKKYEDWNHYCNGQGVSPHRRTAE